MSRQWRPTIGLFNAQRGDSRRRKSTPAVRKWVILCRYYRTRMSRIVAAPEFSKFTLPAHPITLAGDTPVDRTDPQTSDGVSPLGNTGSRSRKIEINSQGCDRESRITGGGGCAISICAHQFTTNALCGYHRRSDPRRGRSDPEQRQNQRKQPIKQHVEQQSEDRRENRHNVAPQLNPHGRAREQAARSLSCAIKAPGG